MSPRIYSSLLYVILMWAASSRVVAEPVGAYAIDASDWTMTVETTASDPAKVKDGAPGLAARRMTSLLVSFKHKKESTAESVTLVGFDATMPEHKHGMVVKPRITAVGSGAETRYRIDGVKLHMRGAWRLEFTVRIGEREIKVPVGITV